MKRVKKHKHAYFFLKKVQKNHGEDGIKSSPRKTDGNGTGDSRSYSGE
jgi:hypothetical protein